MSTETPPDGLVETRVAGELLRQLTAANLRCTEKAGEAAGLRIQLTAAQEENIRIRAALAQSPGACAYCQLPKERWAECRSGFPGCGRLDDAQGCPEFGASMERDEIQKELTAAQAEIERLKGVMRDAFLEGYWAGRAGKHDEASWTNSHAKWVMEGKR